MFLTVQEANTLKVQALVRYSHLSPVLDFQLTVFRINCEFKSFSECVDNNVRCKLYTHGMASDQTLSDKLSAA